MKPLIKWPGGKFGEYKYIEKLIPCFDRYIEPFFGGGAIYFHLKPRKALINDLSSDLMKFYTYIKQGNEDFRDILYTYNYCWAELMSQYIEALYPEIHQEYLNYRTKQICKEELLAKLDTVMEQSKELFDKLFSGACIGETGKLYQEIHTNLLGKIKRMVELEIKMGKPLDEKDLKDNIKTGFRSGLYMHFRNIYNEFSLGKRVGTLEEKIANFYFMREFCYGSMFRYNRQGHFNIPYGGIAYNKKNFKRKLDHLFMPETAAVFANTELYNLDFESFLHLANLNENDFIFLDPPYDSDFSDYEGVNFNQNDQRRLANFLVHTKAKFILIIKNTDYVFELYNGHPNFKIMDFAKQYTYNVRSRNNRSVKHLIITNCLV